MKAEHIKDRETLEALLRGRPWRASIVIAHRATLRVLPRWGAAMGEDWARKGDLTVLPLLRCGLISAVAGTWPTADIKRETADAAATAADALALERGEYPLRMDLWPQGAPDWIVAAGRDMLAIWDSEPPARWDLWRRWWEGPKTGQPVDPELLLAIVKGIDEETWNDPDKVAAAIARIKEQFGLLLETRELRADLAVASWNSLSTWRSRPSDRNGVCPRPLFLQLHPSRGLCGGGKGRKLLKPLGGTEGRQCHYR